ncbi:MAG: N-acetylmuramoyl-L-alanine amidase [Candidatus Sulfotelmatobacter sp.]
MKSPSRRRGLWGALLALAMFAGVGVPAAQARARHSEAWAREHFATAERMREALNGRPAAERTRHDYQRVLNAYRFVYLGAPSSAKADPSVVAVAETLVEMGRRFDDDKILHEAIAQYKFLRREYPGSKYRSDGLFTIGEIYKDDLNDGEAARAAFREFLHHYPHNRLAGDARQAIAELSQAPEKGEEAQKGAEKTGTEKNSKDAQGGDEDSQGLRAASGKDESPEPRPERLPRVTGIRHWSTPDYTRVAIDLESDVKFSSERLEHPARIFFDLRGTKLASTLVGKSLDVDDGFLKKVRVAQFAPGRTRVVLEVDNLSDYNAFLLPNPYRLIIDIHGKNGRAKRSGDKGADAITVDEADDVASPEGVPGAGPERKSPEGKPDVLTHGALERAGKALVAGMAAGDDAKTSASEANAENRKPSKPVVNKSVVKRIVEADDDDRDSGSAAVEVARRDAPGVSESASKEGANGDADTDADTSDSGVTAAGRRNAGGARHKAAPQGSASDETPGDAGFAMREAKPTADGDRSLIRVLGLKIGKIVIDPGHGGHDTGTIGPDGLEEKDVVLDVGRRLGKLLETRLGAEVVYTRKDDTFVPLETRTAIANQARADLFISIHANSSDDPEARGVETYYLNFTSSPEALEVAARENAVSEQSIYELQDLVKKIALKDKIEESREFAGDVEESLHSGLAAKSPAIRDRGVKKAPFIVLIGANMPSILAEISFVSNPTDEHHLASGQYRQRIAEALYRGIAKYANGLSGVKVASKIDKASGQ